MRRTIALLFVITLVVTACTSCAGAPTTGLTTAASTQAPLTPVTQPEIPPEDTVRLDKYLTYYSKGSGWQDIVYYLGNENYGKSSFKFYLTPMTASSTLYLGFADSGSTVQNLTDSAIIIRFNGTWVDAINSNKFDSAAEFLYEPGKIISFELSVDSDEKTYTLSASAPGKEPVLIAENFFFNTFAGTTDDMGKVFFISQEDNEFKIEGLATIASHNPTEVHYSTSESNGWENNGIMLGKSYSGKVKIEFDMTADGNYIDGSVDFTDTEFEVAGFGDLAVLVRMHSNGFFDVRNGDKGQQSLVQVPYMTNTPYRIEIHVDTDGKTYTVFVTPPDGEKIMIAKDYRFRVTAEHADDLGKVYVISAERDNQVILSNLWIDEVESYDENIVNPISTNGTTPAQNPTTTANQTTAPPVTTPPITTKSAGSNKGECWLEPAANVYKINGTNYLSYYPTLERSDIKRDIRIRANQFNLIARRHPDVKVYSYYITKTEDLNWFDESEGIKAFDYEAYMSSFLSDDIRHDKLKINTFEDLASSVYMTDHHWNYKGSNRGYIDIIEMIRKDFDIPEMKSPIKEEDFGLDLKWYGSKYKRSGGAKNVEPEEFKVYKYDIGTYTSYLLNSKTELDGENRYDKGNINTNVMTDHYSTYHGDHTDLCSYEFQGNKYNCLMIGDSNTFAVRKLIASHFSKLYYIDKYVLSNYNIDSFIEENDIDLVLFLGQLDLFENRDYVLQGYPTTD
ncbi:MAG: hypothetical protein PHV32_12850 [Eubacteriales bacterium]|nr:hypothetical protein [Eubacteriales bacterium]